MPLKYFAIIVLLLPLWGCNGIFAGIYDDPDDYDPTATEYGFTKPCTASEPGTIYLDSRDFAHWIYIDFSERTVVTLGVDDPAPQQWDMAIHHYDARTNGGEAAVTDTNSFETILSGKTYKTGPYQPDILTVDKIAIDLSDMLSGNIVYQESDYNPVLSSWMSVDINQMPPDYKHSDHIISLLLADGSQAMLRLASYTNQLGSKGFLTLQYLYLDKPVSADTPGME
ncbi:MAG: HmuY family protein [Muribaculaceae bacterium]|nr:HmuY family protein [Muribaculaceae bacterium]